MATLLSWAIVWNVFRIFFKEDDIQVGAGRSLLLVVTPNLLATMAQVLLVIRMPEGYIIHILFYFSIPYPIFRYWFKLNQKSAAVYSVVVGGIIVGSDLLLLSIGYMLRDISEEAGILLMVLVIGIAVVYSIYRGINDLIEERDAKKRAKEVHQNLAEQKKLLEEQAIEIRELKLKPYTKIITGTVIKNISNSTVINDSTVGSIANIAENSDEKLAEALLEIANQIATAKNPEAAELFESFTSELESAAPKKSTLKSLWDSLNEALPTISNLIGVAERIGKIIA